MSGSRAVLVTPVAEPQVLAAACALAKIRAEVVPTEVGSVAVLHEAEGEGPAAAGATLSRVVTGALVVLLRTDGSQVTAAGWTDGRPTEVQAAGLWLDAAPAVLEDLVTGQAEPSGLEGVVSSAGMSRWRAARTLARLARKARS